jgi:hypothetical protein
MPATQAQEEVSRGTDRLTRRNVLPTRVGTYRHSGTPTQSPLRAIRAALVWTFLLAAAVLVVAAGGLGPFALPPPNTGFRDAAAVLAIVTSAAVAIERALEFFWTAKESVLGRDSPLEPVGVLIDLAVKDLDDATGLFLQEADSALQHAKTAGKLAVEQIATAEAQIAALKLELKRLNAEAPTNPQVQQLIQLVGERTRELEQHLPAVKDGGEITRQSLTVLSGVVASTTDNPGRRLIGLLAGATFGLAVAAAFGLDLFHAGLDAPAAGRWGIAFTGLVLGLGANPTHEVIRAVQEYKERQKARS